MRNISFLRLNAMDAFAYSCSCSGVLHALRASIIAAKKLCNSVETAQSGFHPESPNVKHRKSPLAMRPFGVKIFKLGGRDGNSPGNRINPWYTPPSNGVPGEPSMQKWQFNKSSLGATRRQGHVDSCNAAYSFIKRFRVAGEAAMTDKGAA